MDLDERKLRILSAVVENFIATGDPVGSKLVAQLLGNQVSSATVRNDMSALFDMGLVEQPHTSAGRVPSHLGYRVYVDRLMHPKPVPKRERDEIDALFNVKNPDPDRLLEAAAGQLAQRTQCAAFTLMATPASVKARRIEILPAGERTAVIVLIATNGVVRNKVIRVDFSLTQELLKFINAFSNAKLGGLPLREISAGYINSVAVSLGEYSRIFTPLLAAVFSGITLGVSLALMYMRGTSSGGTDFLTMSIKMLRPHLSVGAVTGLIDLFIILLGWPVFGSVDAVLYGLITTAATSLVIDKVMYGSSSSKMLTIITTKGQEIADCIARDADRGSTMLRALGTYTGTERQMLLCVCARPQVYTIRTAAYRIDPSCMVMISDTSEVYGEGFIDPEQQTAFL